MLVFISLQSNEQTFGSLMFGNEHRVIFAGYLHSQVSFMVVFKLRPETLNSE